MATEISGELTNDELTVLMIAARGESMIPIGRWAQPLKTLVAKGFMLAHDEANYVITDTGRAAQESTEDDDIRALLAARNKTVSDNASD